MGKKPTSTAGAEANPDPVPAAGGEGGTPNGAAPKSKVQGKVGARSRRRRGVATRGSAKSSSGGKSEANGRGGSRAQRPFPARTLEEALAIPKAIREKNNGKEWDSEQVAQASLGIKKNNNRFYYLAAASRDYGLTVGGRDTEKVALTQLGHDIVFAGDETTARSKRIEAFFSVDIFKKVYDHYGSGKLPEDQYLNNTLQREFNLPGEFHADFRRIFEANCKFLGIENGLGKGAAPTEVTRSEHGADIRVVGEAKGKFDRTAFVIMPFVEKGQLSRPAGFFKEVLTKLITPAANQAGFAVETADQDGSDVIQSTIINQLLKGDNLVITDLTDHNPNVLFELGIRIAKELPVALIKADGTGRIFDVDNMMRVLTYSSNLWPSTVETDLPKLSKHIKAAWDNRTTGKNYMQILTNAPPATMIEAKPVGSPVTTANA
jgi:hypothetical protein